MTQPVIPGASDQTEGAVTARATATPRAASLVETVPITVIGGPTVLIEYGGLRLLTDPTFDAPQAYPGAFEKTAGPSIDREALGRIDAVLLSHDEHVDNLDLSGRALLAGVPVTFTTRSGAGRLTSELSGSHEDPAAAADSTVGLAPWESVQLPRPDGGTATISATPALHGPAGAESVVGEVIGFLVTSDDLPTVYISGDNASLDVVREIAGRTDHGSPIDTAVLFAGAVRRPVLDGALLTLDADAAVQAAQILDARRIVLAHVEGWAHFTEGPATFAEAFRTASLDGTIVTGPGILLPTVTEAAPRQ